MNQYVWSINTLLYFFVLEPLIVLIRTSVYIFKVIFKHYFRFLKPPSSTTIFLKF